MKITKLLALVLAFAMVVALCACGSTGNDAPATGDTNSDAANDTTSNTQPAEGTEDTTADPVETTEATVPEGKAVYTVTVVDEGGNPVAGAMVQLCLDACIPGVTNEKGVATYTVDVADYKVSFVSLPQGYSCDESEFYFDAGSYEMTITLKAVA